MVMLVCRSKMLNPCTCFTYGEGLKPEVSHVEAINVHGSFIERAENYFSNLSDTDNRQPALMLSKHIIMCYAVPCCSTPIHPTSLIGQRSQA